MFSAYDFSEMFDYLDDLRFGGSMNMAGAAPALAEDYDTTREEARRVLELWMATFDENKTPQERATMSLATA